jgi:hypothetical protein
MLDHAVTPPIEHPQPGQPDNASQPPQLDQVDSARPATKKDSDRTGAQDPNERRR